MALGRNHRIFNIGNSSGSYGISRVYHDETLSGDGTLSSLLGVVGGAGDTEVNEFVYNNSGDIINVNDVVQSNSANWNEVSSKLDASAFDPNEFYPMTGNPSGFLTAVDLSDVVLNSAINYYRPEYGVSGISGRELYAISSKYAALDEHGHGLIEPYNYINNNSARIGDVVLNYEQTSASYVVVNNNSANWNDISAYQQNSANYLTAHQSLDGYATTAWVEEQGYLTAHQDISNKLDASAFSDVSGTFLTAVPAGYATTGEVYNVSSVLSAAIDAQSGNVYTGIDPIVVNNDDKAISANTWAFSAGNGISFVDDNINKITRIDVTAQGGVPQSAFDELKASYDALSSLFATYSGQWLLPNVQTNTKVLSSTTANVTFNDGTFDHDDDFGFVLDNTLSDWCSGFDSGKLSAVIQFTNGFSWGKSLEKIRWSYTKTYIEDNNFCGEWNFDENTHTMTAVISGFGANSASPTAYPVYLSLPYTNRNKGESNPITISGYYQTQEFNL